MIQTHSVNSSPIKPAVSFGQSKAVAALEMTSDWVDTIDDKGLSEDSFKELQGFTGKMNDGPLKTTATIFALAGASALALKKGGAKLLRSMRGNATVAKNVLNPLTMKVKNGLVKLEANIGEKVTALKEEKGMKNFVLKNSKKGLDWVKTYSQRGVESTIEANQARLEELKDITAKAILKKGAQSGSKKPTAKQLAALVEENLLKGKSKNAEEYRKLAKEIELAPTNNLIDKVTGNVLGAGAAVGTTVEASKDKDKNGIPDIAERKAKKAETDYKD